MKAIYDVGKGIHLDFKKFINTKNINIFIGKEKFDNFLLGDSEGLCARFGDETNQCSPAASHSCISESVHFLVNKFKFIQS